MKAVTVSQVNEYIADLLQDNGNLQRLSVEGEVSNLKYHYSGHVYFTLKDNRSAISAVMFAGDKRTGLTFPMQNGDKVVVNGRVGVYTKSGQYQIYAKKIERAGQGDLYLRFEQLKKELSEMGMFDQSFKQPIPAYAHTIGVVTASTGAAIRDIIQISKRRNPYVQIILCPAQVQGKGAAESIVRGIERLDEMGLDLLIVGRGGGSLEDLWAFNEKEVAYAIFNAKTPIISAVGHEIDFTIADFVADLRAPTPSAAAELAVSDIKSIEDRLEEGKNRLDFFMTGSLNGRRERLQAFSELLRHRSPDRLLDERRRYLLDTEERLLERMDIRIRNDRQRILLYEKMGELMGNRLRDQRNRLSLLAKGLEGRSPVKRLEAGFAYPETKDKKHFTSVRDLKVGQEFYLRMKDGRILAKTEEIEDLKDMEVTGEKEEA